MDAWEAQEAYPSKFGQAKANEHRAFKYVAPDVVYIYINVCILYVYVCTNIFICTCGGCECCLVRLLGPQNSDVVLGSVIMDDD